MAVGGPVQESKDSTKGDSNGNTSEKNPETSSVKGVSKTNSDPSTSSEKNQASEDLDTDGASNSAATIATTWSNGFGNFVSAFALTSTDGPSDSNDGDESTGVVGSGAAVAKVYRPTIDTTGASNGAIDLGGINPFKLLGLAGLLLVINFELKRRILSV